MCILLAEDEPLIRMIMAEGLEDAGYEVCVAEDGRGALALIDEHGENIRMLVTDIHMPGGLTGIEVASVLRSRLPDAAIIYMTGRPDVLRQAATKLGTRDLVIEKPFTPSELVAAARRLLKKIGSD